MRGELNSADGSVGTCGAGLAEREAPCDRRDDRDCEPGAVSALMSLRTWALG